MLSGAVLAKASLRGAQLRQACLAAVDLKGANLAGADLANADLEAADLEGANLEEADVLGANLRRSVLRATRLRGIRGLARAALNDADFEGASGLTGDEFAGADLAGVRLPATLSFEARLAYIAESSQNARPAFLSILLSCVLIILTVISTPDHALLSNASLALLPDLSINIPAASFFWVAPILLLGLYVYLHLQMFGIGETLASLPAVFPDGTPLDRRAYPWIGTKLLRMKGGWKRLQFEEILTILLLWGTVPATLLAIWIRYLPLRDWLVSGVHVVLITGCASAAMRFFEQTASTMSCGRMQLTRRRPLLCILAAMLTAVTLGVGLFPIVFDANPRKIGFFVVDIRASELKGMDLRKKDLRYATASKSDVSGSDLRDSDLRRADFQRSRFEGADLESARLDRTDLDGSDFQNACLRKAVLMDADLEDADFRGAYLGLADLRTPLLTRGNFADANLQGANLRGAVLAQADFSGASIGCFVAHRKEPDSVVECPDFAGAILDGARLSGADLRYVRGLTPEQLASACGDAQTQLPHGLFVPMCPEGRAVEPSEPRSSAQNPCEHEMRDDRWQP